MDRAVVAGECPAVSLEVFLLKKKEPHIIRGSEEGSGITTTVWRGLAESLIPSIHGCHLYSIDEPGKIRDGKD